jgi:ABC-2 type transport system ATP-binding protein
MSAVLPRPASAGGTLELRCQGLEAGYFGSRVLEGVSFSVTEPSIYVVLGPNGAGKTTLFRTIAGILPPSAGRVTLGGVPVGETRARERLHFLSHIDGIPDGLRVDEALAFYARVQGANADDVERVLDRLAIAPLRHHFLSELSAGQRKRVSVARIFLKERDLYLLDEPTSNLDPKVAAEIRDLVLGLAREKVVLYSSHNLYEAREIGRYVLALKQGRVSFFGGIGDLKSERYVLGVRTVQPSEALAGVPKRGEYYLFELPGPEGVPALLRQLEGKGVLVREAREMGNPLEDLFT